MVMVLKCFFGERVNFYTGVRLLASSGDGILFRFTCVLAFFMQDEKAHKMTFDIKGASGNKACPKCKNCLRCDVARVPSGGYWFHLSAARPDSFDLHTRDTYIEMVALLDARHGVLRAGKFAELESVLGLSRCPLGLLWEPSMRLWCNPVDTIFEDAMHTLVGSGGCCQYEINGFMHVLGDHGISTEEVDALISQVGWPKEQRSIWPRASSVTGWFATGRDISRHSLQR